MVSTSGPESSIWQSYHRSGTSWIDMGNLNAWGIPKENGVYAFATTFYVKARS